jgi:hypothetical protein
MVDLNNAIVDKKGIRAFWSADATMVKVQT